MIQVAKNQAFSNAAANVAQSLPALGAESAQPVEAGEQQLKLQARNLIGSTFYATLLKQMHDSPFKSELFSGGRGGEAFNGLYDQQLASRMAQRCSDKLIRPIVKKFRAAANAAYRDQTRQPGQAHVAHDRRA